MNLIHRTVLSLKTFRSLFNDSDDDGGWAGLAGDLGDLDEE